MFPKPITFNQQEKTIRILFASSREATLWLELIGHTSESLSLFKFHQCGAFIFTIQPGIKFQEEQIPLFPLADH